MINTKEGKRFIERKVISITCDICGKTYCKTKDIFEVAEFHHINFIGGYGSVFGDEALVQCDICQHCLYKMIKDYARIE